MMMVEISTIRKAFTLVPTKNSEWQWPLESIVKMAAQMGEEIKLEQQKNKALSESVQCYISEKKVLVKDLHNKDQKIAAYENQHVKDTIEISRLRKICEEKQFIVDQHKQNMKDSSKQLIELNEKMSRSTMELLVLNQKIEQKNTNLWQFSIDKMQHTKENVRLSQNDSAKSTAPNLETAVSGHIIQKR